jgi:ornithine cyclodeaminase/alanine dehydrogenase-like protein (mu-crystallin family)
VPDLTLLSEADVAAVAPMRDIIDALESGLRAQAAGRVDQPVRSMVRNPAGFFGSMPCGVEGAGLGAKLVTFFPGNGKLGLHTHHAIIALFDPERGLPTALIDGRLITEMRTAGMSAIATRALAVEGAGTVAILGTGVQARSHVRALMEIGMLRELRVWGRTAANVETFSAWAREQGVDTTVCGSAHVACAGAQIVCTLTPAQAPILESYDVEPGTHVNAVGSSAPVMQELATALVGRATLFVDTVEGAMREAGDILAAIREGVLPAEPDLTRLCDVVDGRTPGRRQRDDVTIFKSLGMALEDVACAAMALERARARGIGTRVHI